MSNHRNVIVHVHIFKNAGSSLDGALERNFKDAFVDHREDHLIRTNEEFLKEYLQKHENIQVFSSHSVYFKPRSFDNVNLHPIYMLRHPIERIKSVYNFEKKQPAGDSLGAKMAKQFNFEEYVSWRMQDDVPPTIRNLQTVFLAGANHHANHLDKKFQLALETLNESPLIGVVDRYDESMVVFEEYLRPFFPDIDLSYVRKNVTDTNIELSVEEKVNKILMQFDTEMQEKIKKKNEYDLELYERANTLLDEKIDKIDNFREILHDFQERCRLVSFNCILKKKLFANSIELKNGTKVLLENFQNTYVDYFPVKKANTIVLTFAPANAPGSKASLTDLGWGFKYYSKFNISIMSFKPKENDWYRGKDLIEFFSSDEFLKIINSYKHIYLIGSSMGGFAALTFSSISPKSIVIAFAPQISLNKSIVPFETRFHKDYLDWESKFNNACDGAKIAKKVYVVYDHFYMFDKKHVEMLPKHNLVQLKFPFLEHAIAENLHKIGLLKKIFEKIVIERENIDIKTFHKWAKKRKFLEWYYQILSRNVKSIEKKICIYEIAKKNNPNIPVYNFQLSKLYYEVNNSEKALFLINEALVIEPNNSRYLVQKANLLFEMDKKNNALILLKKAVELEPDNMNYKARLANLLNAMHLIEEANSVIDKVIEIEKNNTRFQEIAARIKKRLGKNRLLTMSKDINKHIEIIRKHNTGQYWPARHLLNKLINKRGTTLDYFITNYKDIETDDFYTLLDIVFNTFSYLDLSEYDMFIKHIDDAFNSLEDIMRIAHIYTLVKGDMGYLELGTNYIISQETYSLSEKLVTLNTYKRELNDIRRSIKPKHLLNLSNDLILSLKHADRNREIFLHDMNKKIQFLINKDYKHFKSKISLNSQNIVILLEDFFAYYKSTVTKLILDWIYCVGLYCPEINIDILVTRDFSVQNGYAKGQKYENKVLLSEIFEKLNLLNSYTKNIKIIYREPTDNLLQWFSSKIGNKDLLSLVIFPSPKWPLPIALKKYFPIVGIELANGVNLNEMVDIVLPNGIINEKTKEKYGNKIYSVDFPQIPFPKESDYSRSAFNIDSNSCIVVSVGRHLVTRSGKEWLSYIERVIKLLQNYNELIWIFVGENKNSYMKNVNQEFVQLYKKNRIILIEEEKDLMALYDICDIFAMPPIGGGGRGIGLATSSSLPCISFKVSDGAKSLPGNLVFSEPKQYFKMLEDLIINDKLRYKIGLECKNIFGEELLKKSAFGLVNACKMANKNFQKEILQ